jgi:hypothetical protein
MMKHFGGSGRPAKRHDLARNFPIAHNSLASFVAITINSGGNRTLKSCATAILLSCLMPALANPAHAADAKANPADYPLAIHVSASTYATPANTLNEIVTATIDGKHYQLQGPASGARIFTHGNGLINPGDYHAKLTIDEHKTSYESLQQFEILFPDGTTRKFGVIGQSE